jgi:hypothetical protein
MPTLRRVSRTDYENEQRPSSQNAKHIALLWAAQESYFSYKGKRQIDGLVLAS